MVGRAICVVGASNLDLVSYVPRLPRLGETLHGTRFQIGFAAVVARGRCGTRCGTSIKS
jgi:hypothetical protein